MSYLTYITRFFTHSVHKYCKILTPHKSTGSMHVESKNDWNRPLVTERKEETEMGLEEQDYPIIQKESCMMTTIQSEHQLHKRGKNEWYVEDDLNECQHYIIVLWRVERWSSDLVDGMYGNTEGIEWLGNLFETQRRNK